ncbi:MAG: SpoIIE family protein phosphatase [Fibrobacter sp.]|nr:SpoIIE family protein phosphatase [Fibrobacter sp.]
MNIENAVTVLIVDDDPTSVLILENLMKHEGYKTVSTVTGSLAIPLAKNRKPDLILLDVNLPGEHGPDICRKIKATPQISEIPILFLSADSNVGSKIECFDAGGQDYITKPFEPREVLARVNTHLRLQQTQKTLTRVLSSKINEISKAQQALLPPKPSEFPDAKFAVRYQQLTGAGGDFYDVMKIGDGVYDYITADVCGHDHSIAFVTAALKSVLIQNSVPQNTPAEILSIANKVMTSVLQSGQFVSISWVRINRVSKKALIVNAGQPPVVFLPLNGHVRTIHVSGDIVGIFENVFFEQREIDITEGDRFLLCSDGIVEVGGKKPEHRAAGIERLVTLCESHKVKNLNKFIQSLVPIIIGDDDVNDDIVILGVEI